MRRRSSGSWVPVFDLMLAALALFMIAALLVHSKDPARIATEGKYAVTITWAPKANDDVDLWMADPVGNICYFGASYAGLMHLEHDDRGTSISETQQLPDGKLVVFPYNGERVVLAGTIPGSYVVNVAMWDKRDIGPRKVIVRLWKLDPAGGDKVIHSQVVTLTFGGQEVTAFRFVVNVAGKVVTYNRLPRSLAHTVGTPAGVPNYNGTYGAGGP